MVILVPILTAAARPRWAIDLVHFGIVLPVNLVIGQITPPVGVLMFVASAVSRTLRLGQIAREIWLFVGALVAALAAITYLPEYLSLWLPQVLNR
ncbi:MAG: TRAP transporter large permease subunit [Chromatiales bacterium]|nr:TRAP transporter large permease subunit [Chromatiales bacterium]